MSTNNKIEKGRLCSIQAWRALAALLVLFFHTSWGIKFQLGEIPLGGVFLIGFSGVPIFFVLSGFIILFIHYQDIGIPKRFFGFIRKRFVRIYPIYIAILLFYILYSSGIFNFYATVAGWKTFYLENFSLIRITDQPSIVPVAWTLYYEIMFYLLFSTLIVQKKIGLIVMFAWILSIIVKAVFPGLIPLKLMTQLTLNNDSDAPMFIHVINIYTHHYNLLFFLGMASFFCYQFLSERQEKDQIGVIACTTGLFIFIGLSIWLLLNVQFKSDADWGRYALYYGIAAFFLMLSNLSGKIQGFFSSRTFILLIGEASYSIYLIHVFFNEKTINFFSTNMHLNCNFLFMLCVLFSLFIGILFHLIIEKPVLNILARKTKQRIATV